MSFQYTVMDEETAMQERFQLLPKGEYDACIVKSEDKVSSNSGNPMMDMTLEVYDNEGRGHTVRDFIVFTKSMMWKAIHFAKSAGIIDQYKSGQLCSMGAQGKSVRVKIGIEEGRIIPEDKLQGKLVGSKYPDKNKVEDYINKSSKPSPSTQGSYTRPATKNTSADPLDVLDDEDVPF